MKRSLWLCTLFAAGLWAQPTAKLDSDLAALSGPNPAVAAIANRVTDDILGLAEKDSMPSRQAALDLAIALTRALAAKPLRPYFITAASGAVLEVLQSSGTSSGRFHQAVDRFRQALIQIGATSSLADAAAGKLMILGQEVRGPDDYQFENRFRSK